MADTSSPYGLRPVKRVDGLPWTNSIETYLINPAGFADNIFNGQVVALTAAGYVELVSETGANGDAFPAGTLGVFVGCEYVNSEGRVVHSQYYPAATTGVVKAKIITDPNVVFRGQMDGAIDQSDIGANTWLAASQIDGSGDSVGSTVTGNSQVALESTTGTTAAAFRILAVVDEVGNSISDTYADVLVKFNPGHHSYTNAVGI